MNKHRDKIVEIWQRLSCRSKDKYIRRLQREVWKQQHLTTIRSFTKTLRRFPWPPPGLAFANAFLTFLYLALINPPMQHILEIPVIMGAAMSTLVITYSASDILLTLITKQFKREP